MAKSNRSYIFLGCFLFVVFCIVSFIFWIYGQRFDEIFPTVVFGEDPKRATYGVIGDFFGGILNPILTFCGFVFLIYTILQNQQMLDHNQEMLKLSKEQLEKSTEELALNRQEMELSRTEMEGSKKALEMQAKTLEIQRFESTFFNLLKLHKDTVDNIKINKTISFDEAVANRTPEETGAIKELSGIYSLQHIYELLSDYFRKIYQEYEDLDKISNVYESFFVDYKIHDIHKIFGILFSLLDMIDKSKFIDEKPFYINLLKTQMPSLELLFLAYHCTSSFSINLTPLAKKYGFLNDINYDEVFYQHKAILISHFSNQSQPPY